MNTLTLVPAEDFRSRLVGLIGRRPPNPGVGLWLRPCDAVHTMGLRFAIDVVFVDAAGRVKRIDERVRPWRARICLGAHSVVELAAGEARRLGLEAGDAIAPPIAAAVSAGEGRS
ncbi:MAG: DUF192 domain-containing protein [Burkholderiaceae bacterium]